MSRAVLAAMAAAVSLAMFAPVAAAQTAAPCYEYVPVRPRIEPSLPMLVDKCSGRTWLLRGGRGGYRWAVIEMELDKPKTTDRPVTDHQPARKDDGKKCFTFNDRKFCE
jgi:hypothetical protein